MTNIYYDICALAILMLFMGSVLARKQMYGRTNYIMFVMMAVSILATIGDLGGAMIEDFAPATRLSRTFCYVLNFLYFLMHNIIMPIYILYIYSSIDIWHLFIKKKSLKVLWWVVVGVDTLALFLNGFLLDVYRITPDVKYQRGPWIAVFYICAAIHAVWVLAILAKYRKIINKDKMLVLIFIAFLLMGGVIIQFIIPGMAIEMFSIALAFMFFMVVVRREEAQVDPITGAIKYNEGVERVSKNFVSRKPSNVVFIKIRNHKNILMYLGQDNYNDFLHSITDNLRRICKDTGWRPDVYYLENGLYSLIDEGKSFELAKETADRINEYLSSEIELNEFKVIVNKVLCIVRYPEDINDFATLSTIGGTFHRNMNAQDDVIIYSDYHEDKDYKLKNDIEEIIARGLKNNNFEMYYQPIYSTRRKKFVCAEALLRLKDEEYGFVSPGLFLPIAEINGSIHEIGDYVTNSVIEFIASTDMKGLGLEYIDMNLSAAQCIEVDLVDKIITKLEDCNVPTSMLRLEITETAADINPEIVDENVRKLQEFGIRFSLDDYGTGYSNIKRVTSLPIDQVKLDKNFVDMIDDPMMWIVIQDTIKMLKEMGQEIIVEGVEDEHVAKKFMDLRADLLQGCELIQGFYFCKPLPADEFIKFMEEHNN